MDFDATFDQCYRPLVRYCQRLTGDADLAEDIAQESLVRLFDRGVTGTDAGIRAWLFKTATHLVRDGYRVGKNRMRLLDKHPVTPAVPETPERSVEREEARARTREVLAALPERDREILLLRYSGFSYKEIAAVIQVAATSVGTLLARAERRFAEAFTAIGKGV